MASEERYHKTRIPDGRLSRHKQGAHQRAQFEHLSTYAMVSILERRVRLTRESAWHSWQRECNRTREHTRLQDLAIQRWLRYDTAHRLIRRVIDLTICDRNPYDTDEDFVTKQELDTAIEAADTGTNNGRIGP